MKRREWMPLWALVRKELGLAWARPVVWGLQVLFLGALAVQVMQLVRSEARDAQAAHLLNLAYFLVIAPLLVVPFLASGVLRDEEESGMLEVLAVSPVPRGRLLASLIDARLLLIAQFVLIAMPILAVIPVAGVAVSGELAAKTLVAVGLGCTLTLLFTLHQLGMGVHPRLVDLRIALFALATPFVLPFRDWLRLLVAFGLLLVFKSWVSQGSQGTYVLIAFGCALFPLYGMLWSFTFDFPGQGIESMALVSWAVSLAAVPILWNRARTTLGRWLLRGFEHSHGGLRQLRPTRAGREPAVGLLQRLKARSEGQASGMLLAPAGDGPVRLMTHTVIQDIGQPAQWVYRASGRHPWVVRRLLDRDASALQLGFQWTAIAGGLLISIPGQVPLSTLTVAADLIMPWVLPIVAVPSLVRLLPPRRRARDLDLILCSPLTGSRLVSGMLWVAFLTAWPVLLALGVLYVVVALWGLPLVGFTYLLHMVVCLASIAAVTLACSLILRRTTGRMVASLLALLAVPALLGAVLDLAGFPSRGFLDPVRALLVSISTGLPAALLLGACAVAFDRFARR